jgi:dihydrofolate synthase/folylpolyglutamate synthase
VRKVIYFHDDFSSAWQFIQSHASKQDRVVAFGSFLVVSGMLNVLAKRESQ